MNKKFFTLIHGDAINVAPKTKVVPASEFSTLLDSQELLEKTKADAEKYKQQVIKECEKLKEQAQKEGFEAGFQSWTEHVAKLEEEIRTVRAETEKKVVPVALSAAKKIVGQTIEMSDKAIVDIVTNCLKAVATHKKITIYVNKKDVDALETNRNKLKEFFEALEALSIRERPDIERGGCVIETEGGIINAKLENQWRILEAAFEKLMQKQNETHH